ncbi:glycosyl hydrolase family 18 protein [Streptomyces albipurpureus]|uniref:chitinase n=1 Tax=Streptomyces albipurpureus TaxID=2897419 RepID=A0ABT0UMR4_9ACTN|nr:glycosyl hydrolase family 18 protein [Streptomyces sp. CWNU-1]MCM2389745.1 glycosyl hydrolase family 18 protein [Streptomyces sp. CWNU-1]
MPTSPGDLKAVTITDTTIRISWSPSTAPGGIASYAVYVNGHGYSRNTTTETSFTATQLNVATEYDFSVVATGNNGREGYSSVHFKARTTGTIPAPPANPVKMGIFPEDDQGPRRFEVKNLVTSASAARLTHLTYASGKIQNGKCTFGDPYRALQRMVPAELSVDGQRDTSGQAVSGNINQLRKLKELHPQLKILWSFGGSEYSAGFPQALKDPAAFAASCAHMINNRQWAGVFDGIDLHWELPGKCPVTAACDTGGHTALKTLAQASRTALGDNKLLTATIHGTPGRVFEGADYAGAAPYLDWINVKSYDYYTPTSGSQGRGTAFLHSTLYGYWDDARGGHHTYRDLTARGVHPHKIVFGVPSHARGWEGVPRPEPDYGYYGPAYGSLGRGMEAYRTIKTRCPGPQVVSGAAYSHCGIEWWSYDTPVSVAEKMAYTKQWGLGGAFLSDLRSDTDDGELLTAIDTGLR